MNFPKKTKRRFPALVVVCMSVLPPVDKLLQIALRAVKTKSVEHNVIVLPVGNRFPANLSGFKTVFIERELTQQIG